MRRAADRPSAAEYSARLRKVAEDARNGLDLRVATRLGANIAAGASVLGYLPHETVYRLLNAAPQTRAGFVQLHEQLAAAIDARVANQVA